MNFFETLPDLESTHANPFPFPESTMVGLIPVFDDPYFNNFEAYLKAAIYSRQTWLLHSDAYDENVPIKLYIEASQKARAMPILEANTINGADVLWFDAPQLSDTLLGVWGRLGKKLCLYFDPQLSDYEQVVYWDADLFKLESYRHIFVHIKGNRHLTFLLTFTKKRRDWRPKLIKRSSRNVLRGGIEIQDIFERAGLGRVLQEIKGHLTRPAGGLGIYPAKRFHAEHPDFLEWLKAHGPYIGDDEFVIALGAVKFNIFLDNIRRAWGLKHIDINEYLRGNTAYAFVHGKPTHSNASAYRNLLMLDLQAGDCSQASDPLLP